MMDEAIAAVEGALAAGARYADVRVMQRRSEAMTAQSGYIEALVQDEQAGLGVRALIGSSWGFFATSEMTTSGARRAGEKAVETARASARVPGPDLVLGDSVVLEERWENTCEEDPLSVSLAEKGDLLVAVTRVVIEAGADISQAGYRIWDTEKCFVSSDGHRISQRIRECGAAMSATAVGDGETQRRSYPGIGGQCGTSGWEIVRGIDLPGNAGRVAEEAVALLSAPVCPVTTSDLILGSEQMSMQIHESVGHATELDRILGWEAAFAGTSWLDLAQLGALRFGSELMNITADATIPGALGSFGYDDEGTPASRVDIVRNGIWVGVLAGRDSAMRAGVKAGGMVRADGHDRLPMVRMTNIGLEPGPHSLEQMIGETDSGIFMDTNRSWSIDDRRLNFQFGCEIAWQVNRGRLGRMLRNPTYTGISPRFWGSMDMVGGPDELILWGTANCGKGQPMQIVHTGHPAVPCRFRDVRIGVRSG